MRQRQKHCAVEVRTCDVQNATEVDPAQPHAPSHTHALFGPQSPSPVGRRSVARRRARIIAQGSGARASCGSGGAASPAEKPGTHAHTLEIRAAAVARCRRRALSPSRAVAVTRCRLARAPARAPHRGAPRRQMRRRRSRCAHDSWPSTPNPRGPRGPTCHSPPAACKGRAAAA
eukprot:4230379-Prymnesium_polylepis.1